jgi:UDP-N-acetylenolpyruvoylglucosamine reductase
VVALMELMQQRVREACGVELEPEVKRVGVFLP